MAPKNIEIEILTPTATLYTGAVRFIQIPLYDGLIGVLPGHSPMISLLGYGLLSLQNGNTNFRFVLDGGFVEITSRRVNVLTHYGEPLQTVDLNKTREDFQAAQKLQPKGDEEIELRLQRLAAARTRLQYAPQS